MPIARMASTSRRSEVVRRQALSTISGTGIVLLACDKNFLTIRHDDSPFSIRIYKAHIVGDHQHSNPLPPQALLIVINLSVRLRSWTISWFSIPIRPSAHQHGRHPQPALRRLRSTQMDGSQRYR